MARRSLLSALALATSLATGSATSLATSMVMLGCNNAPTLPLPPPVVDVGSPNAMGLVTVRGEALGFSFVSVFNERSEAGWITRADAQGDFEVEIEAEVGDLLTIWIELGGELGERKRATVPPARP